MSEAAFILACLGLVLSVAALTWQAVTFFLAGARVRAELLHGAAGSGGIVSGPPGGQQLATLAQQGWPKEVVGVQVRNIGRLAVTVTGFTVAHPHKGIKYRPVGALLGPAFPYRLDAQSAESWHAPADDVHRMIAVTAQTLGGSDPADLWVEVELGTGKIVKSRERLSMGS